MTYEISFDPRALKEWKKLDETIRKQFKKKLEKLIENPIVESLRLHGDLHGFFKIKLRASGYRLVYQVIEDEIIIFVVAVGKRENSDVYSDASDRS